MRFPLAMRYAVATVVLVAAGLIIYGCASQSLNRAREVARSDRQTVEPSSLTKDAGSPNASGMGMGGGPGIGGDPTRPAGVGKPGDYSTTYWRRDQYTGGQQGQQGQQAA